MRLNQFWVPGLTTSKKRSADSGPDLVALGRDCAAPNHPAGWTSWGVLTQTTFWRRCEQRARQSLGSPSPA